MRFCQVLLAAILMLSAWPCDANEKRQGCKVSGNSCVCGYGPINEYIYKTRKSCHNALKDPTPKRENTNICSSGLGNPCLYRGICILTSNEEGFVCKCEGTGYYGRHCEKACPPSPIGVVFPHECVVI